MSGGNGGRGQGTRKGIGVIDIRGKKKFKWDGVEVISGKAYH